MKKFIPAFAPRLALLALAVVALAAAWLTGLSAEHATLLLATGAAGLDLTAVNKALDGLETKLKSMAEKADGELATLGKVSTDTKTALDTLGTQQRELADRLLGLEQKGLVPPRTDPTDNGWGAQFVKSAAFGDFVGGRAQRMRVEVKNTITNAVGNTMNGQRPDFIGGAFREFTLEQLLSTLPTTSNAVDYVRENVFTNAAAETAAAAVMPESSITTTLVTEPVATVGHWLKISRQLAADNPALAAYIDLRLRYGVNLRVENQIIAGNGTAPNISGFTKAGNFTAHGYAAATLTGLGLSATNRFDLIGKIIGDSWAADYKADVIVLNPADWWTMRLAKDTTGRYILGDPGVNVAPMLFNVPVVACNAVPADNVLVASLANAATFYNREGVFVDMSESDSDNFTKNLITIRAERRCMLAVERPGAVRYGDLTPA